MSLNSKKPKIIPAFLNSLSYNERKYYSHSTLSILCFGVWITYACTIAIPDIFMNNFHVTDLHFIIYWIIIAVNMIEVIQYSRYKKLIKLEPKVKQKKEQEDLK